MRRVLLAVLSSVLVPLLVLPAAEGRGQTGDPADWTSNAARVCPTSGPLLGFTTRAAASTLRETG